MQPSCMKKPRLGKRLRKSLVLRGFTDTSLPISLSDPVQKLLPTRAVNGGISWAAGDRKGMETHLGVLVQSSTFASLGTLFVTWRDALFDLMLLSCNYSGNTQLQLIGPEFQPDKLFAA